MNEKALHLFQQMQTDLSLCRRKGMKLLREIECCFQIADRYWAILRQDLIHHEFDREEKEIEFFKNIKPLFISEAEYYSLVYHVQLFFREENVKEDQQKFLQRESRRLKKFVRKNKDFYDRYKGNCVTRDREWFARIDEEEGTVSSHGHLVATLLALERYSEYLKNEFELTGMT